MRSSFFQYTLEFNFDCWFIMATLYTSFLEGWTTWTRVLTEKLFLLQRKPAAGSQKVIHENIELFVLLNPSHSNRDIPIDKPSIPLPHSIPVKTKDELIDVFIFQAEGITSPFKLSQRTRKQGHVSNYGSFPRKRNIPLRPLKYCHPYPCTALYCRFGYSYRTKPPGSSSAQETKCASYLTPILPLTAMQDG